MAPLQELNAYLADNSFLGSQTGVTLEDYKQCKEIKAGSFDADSLPHLARWHSHVSHLLAKYPTVDYRGVAIPAGNAPQLAASGGGGVGAGKQAGGAGKQAGGQEGGKKGGKEEEGGGKKKEGKKQEKAAAEPSKEAAAEDPEKARKDKLKKVIKEGGKRGVEIEGAADMGGLQFFCTSVDCPEGDVDMLLECLNAMNAKSDPTEEERKGGSGHIGKMIFSAGVEHLAVAAYVPEEKQSELSCEEWLKVVLGAFGGEVQRAAKDVCLGVVKANQDKGVFPLKIREPMILEANNFLRKKGLFPDNDDDDDDEMIFGDDDFPSM